MNHVGPVVAARKAKKISGADFTAQVINCETCGYAHLNPLPTIEELGDFYAYHFYEKQKPDYLEKMERESDYWLELYKFKIKVFMKQSPKKKLRVLDVGSSGGFFLEAAKSLGAEVAGIEPSEKAALYCKEKFNIDVKVDIYEKAQIEDESFDLIHSSLVMEHLLDPKHFVQWSFSKLKSGGLFICESPNEFNKFQKLVTGFLKHEDWFVAYPDHLNYFNESSLKRLSESNGFKFIESFASYPMEQAILSGQDYLKDSSLGKGVHQQRMQLEMNLITSGNESILENYYRFWAQQGIGRTITCVFRRD